MAQTAGDFEGEIRGMEGPSMKAEDVAGRQRQEMQGECRP